MLRALGRYVIERSLGRGGMGSVFLAFDTRVGRHVALKRAHGVSPDDVLRFKREFRAIEPLHHRHLVRLFELGQDDEGLYFTMEAVDGDDLAAWCAAGDRLARAQAVLPQIVSALEFLHEHRVVHCDVKPSNVLVDRDGNVKVVDFGVLAELSNARGLWSSSPFAGAPSRGWGVDFGYGETYDDVVTNSTFARCVR